MIVRYRGELECPDPQAYKTDLLVSQVSFLNSKFAPRIFLVADMWQVVFCFDLSMLYHPILLS